MSEFEPIFLRFESAVEWLVPKMLMAVLVLAFPSVATVAFLIVLPVLVIVEFLVLGLLCFVVIRDVVRGRRERSALREAAE